MTDVRPLTMEPINSIIKAGINFVEVFQMLLDNQNRFSNAFCPPYPQLAGLVASKFKRVTEDRDVRLNIMSRYVGRRVSSAKDMTTAECVVWLKMLERQPFVEYLKEGVHGETQKDLY